LTAAHGATVSGTGPQHVLWVWRYLGIDGGSRVFLDFAEHHDRAAIRLSLCLTEGAHPDVLRRVPADVAVHFGRRPVRRWLRGPLRKLVWKFYVPGQIHNWVRTLRPDCVLCHGRRELYSGCLLKLLGLLRTPLLGRVGSVLSWYLENQRVIPFEDHLAPALLRLPDLIITPTDLASRDLARVTHRPGCSFLTLGNMVDGRRILEQSTQQPPLIPPPYFLVLGSLIARKDPLTVLRAYAALVRDAGVDAASLPGLLYVGCGPLEDRLRQLANELAIGSRVTMAGSLINPYPALAGASAVIHPSRMDGSPFVVAETICLRKPLVYAAGSLGILSLLRAHGIGVPYTPEDPASLTAALRECLSEKSLRGDYDGAIREFDPARFSAGYQEAFRSVRRA
jgi:glycosyltransferase involved in cell wall biosynthesis